MADHRQNASNPNIDWQAIISAIDHGQATAARHHAQAQAQTHTQAHQHAVSQAHASGEHHHTQHRRSRRRSTNDDGYEDGKAQVRRRSESGGGSSSANAIGTPIISSPTGSVGGMSSPGLDTHRYHPAHAQAAAAAQAQAQALVAEALAARNHPIPDDLFTHFARANGLLPPDAGGGGNAQPAPSASVSTPDSAPWSVNASPDLNARIAMQQYGYVSPQQQHLQQPLPSPSLPSLPALAPRAPALEPSPLERRSSSVRRQPSIAIDPALEASSAFVSTNASSAPSLASGSSAPTPSAMGEDTEDKRVRNTLASARFRAKKKLYIENVERNIRDLENQHRELEVEVNDLRKENGLLKEMVQLKYGVRQ